MCKYVYLNISFLKHVGTIYSSRMSEIWECAARVEFLRQITKNLRKEH